MTWGYKGLPRVTRGHRGLQRVKGGYSGLQEMTGGYKELHRVTRGYRGLQLSLIHISEPTAKKKLCKEDMYVCPLNRVTRA